MKLNFKFFNCLRLLCFCCFFLIPKSSVKLSRLNFKLNISRFSGEASSIVAEFSSHLACFFLYYILQSKLDFAYGPNFMFQCLHMFSSPSSSSFFLLFMQCTFFSLQIVNSIFSQFLISPFYFHFKLQNISSKAIQSVESRYSIARKHLAWCHGEPYGLPDCDNFPPHITHTQLASMSFSRTSQFFNYVFSTSALLHFSTASIEASKLSSQLCHFFIWICRLLFCYSIHSRTTDSSKSNLQASVESFIFRVAARKKQLKIDASKLYTIKAE